jgi:hypothetical protein
LKGLGVDKGLDGADFMAPIFFVADAEGFFSTVPLALGLGIPDLIVAETTAEHLNRNFKEWLFRVLRQMFDPDRLGSQVVAVGLSRQGLAD